MIDPYIPCYLSFKPVMIIRQFHGKIFMFRSLFFNFFSNFLGLAIKIFASIATFYQS